MNRVGWCVGACLAAASAVWAQDKDAMPPAVAALLRGAGAAAYAVKTPYGGGVDAVYLGYAQDGAPVVGVALRDTKTYAQARAIVAVIPADGKYKISAAEIPTLSEFHGKSQDLARAALKDITGKVFADEAEAKGLLDGVTGATQYLKAIYVSYSLMATRVIAELRAKPAWARLPVPGA